MSELRIYVACLAAYNAGTLHGKWIDVEGKDADDIYDEVKEMLAASPEPGAEEWAIHDHEGLGSVSEYDSFARIAAIAEKVEEHGPAFIAWLDNETRDIDDFDRFEDQYRGEWDSEKDYAMELASEIGLPHVETPIHLYYRKGFSYEEVQVNVVDEFASYIDWDSVTDNFFQHGSYYSVKTPDYNVWVFDAEG